MTVKEKLSELRNRMAREGIDAYLVPTDDFHSSEYVGDYFKCRKFLTGFTGSAGTALVTADGAYLWTDGRYFLQAGKQLENTGIELMKIGVEGVPTIGEFLLEYMKEGEVLGFDGRCMKAKDGHSYAKLLEKKGAFCRVSSEDGPLDLIDPIWKDRPALSGKKVWELPVDYAGKSRAQKLEEIRHVMEKENCSYQVITSLDSIAWLLNLRGDDVAYTPVFLSYLVMTPERVLLFAMKDAFDREIVEALEKDKVELRNYGEVYAYVSTIPEGSRVMLDPASVNYTICSLLSGAETVECGDPVLIRKAVKNPVEMQHIREAHVKDGVAVTRFIYWLKMQLSHYDPSHPVTEMSAAQKLLELRQEQEHFLGLSFETIMSYGPHGAIVHYAPTPETDVPLEPRSFVLVDSGGQYLEGTTDITRTISCGSLTGEEKEFYTRVLRGNLNLGAARFLYGCSGTAFDYLARRPLWEIGKDYNHGTGHGVGFVLGVHEGPNSFSYKCVQGRVLPCVFEEGMVTSNEPGFYLEGKFGVRCENLTMCVKDEKNEYGQFMRFDTLTMVPWDLDAVDPSLLSEREKALLNEYHEEVFRTISPFLDGEEKEWLGEATRAI